MSLTETYHARQTAAERIENLESLVHDLTATIEALIDHVNRHAMNTEARWPDSHPMFVHEHVMAVWHDSGEWAEGAESRWFVDCSCNIPHAGDGFTTEAAAVEGAEIHADATGGEVVESRDDPRISEYHRRGATTEHP